MSISGVVMGKMWANRDNRLIIRESGQTIVVKPDSLESEDDSEGIVFKLDSGPAFGTGTHPTTCLCIDMIEKYLNPGDSFLDVGTGSGILMILAAKLGAGSLFGIDKSDVAVEAARKNLRLNNIDPARFALKTGNLLEGIEGRYAVVVANILPEIIIQLLDTTPGVLKENGIFICSGLIEGNTHRVLHKMKAIGFNLLETLEKERWVAIAARPEKDAEDAQTLGCAAQLLHNKMA